METRLLRLPAGDGAALGILEKRPRAAAADMRPLLLLHGATFGVAFLDLPLPGYSLMAALAEPGRPVYALDVRGYGNSRGFHAMERAPDQNPPFARLDEAVADVAAAVDFILERQNADTIDLLGLSWGSMAAARYAGENPERIGRLVLYAPLYGEANAAWLDRIADPQDRGRLDPKFGAYRLIASDDVVQRWNSDLPAGDPAQYRDDGLAEAVFETLAALDPQASSRTPRAFRCPNGALADLVEVFNGKPLYDPAKLIMPVLLLRGAGDTTSTESDSLQLLSQIGSHEKDYRVVSPGSHFLCIEKNRSKLHEEINRFLGRRSHASGCDRK